MTRPNITLDQLQQAVLSMRKAKRIGADLALEKGKKPVKIQVRYADLSAVLYFLGDQDRIAELHGRDTTP